jgi:uncharacterized protein YdeI (BOF family)
MKTKLILLFLIITTVVRAQHSLPLGGGQTEICFNHNYDDLILIDTNQVWHIAQPEKDILFLNGTDALVCGNIAIITDTNKYYSKNLNSYFQIAVRWDIPLDFAIRILHKYDFQENRDGGIIEISYDNGLKWKNIINDTAVVDSSEKGNLTGLYTTNDTVYSFNNQLAFTGTQTDLSEITIPFRLQNLNPDDFAGTAIIRFRIATDSIDSDNEGWMISAISVNGWIQGAIKDINSNPDITVFLDSSNELYVSINNEEIKQIDIISIDGKLVHHNTNSDSINVSHLQKGIYLVIINNLYSKKILKN